MTDASRLRASLDSRILNASAGVDSYPLRRRMAYQRVLRRLAEHQDGGWVVKGGYLLEARLDIKTRATKDLDLVMRTVADGGEVLKLLREALSADPDGDFFTFQLSAPTPLADAADGSRGWKVTIDSKLDGRTFAKMRIDVVERLHEVESAVEQIVIAVPVPISGFSAAVVTAVDIAQHAAEKFHAMCIVYPDGRFNTRVKDLLDIVLMAEAGLLPHPNLPARIDAVFMARDGAGPPSSLPIPPAAWANDYASLAATTAATIAEVEPAFQLASSLFAMNQTVAAATK